jgi:elongation factor P
VDGWPTRAHSGALVPGGVYPERRWVATPAKWARIDFWYAASYNLADSGCGGVRVAISTADFRTGLTIETDGGIFQIIEFQHVKPGKGGAFVRTRLRNIRTGAVIDKTWRAGERMEQAMIARRPMQFLYRSGDEYVFMDTETFDQTPLSAERVGEGVKYLKPDVEVMVMVFGEEILGVELPNTMELAVTETDPGLRGDTATGGTKPATLETGAVVNVPLFVNEGDVLRIDTRTGKYLERASS